MKQDENQKLNIKHCKRGSEREKKDSLSRRFFFSPHPQKAAVPVGPRKRPIAGIGRDHRTPNETSLAYLLSHTGFPFCLGGCGHTAAELPHSG